MQNDIKFLVGIRCYTYNHAPFIVDAMNGFAMQQTTFPFICAIVDDASTDGEQDVIIHYLEEQFDEMNSNTIFSEDTDDYRKVVARHRTNSNCYFAVYFLKYNHYRAGKSKLGYLKKDENVKYLATCEGDDYWIAPDKLQRQVDFLESNPDYCMCYTRVKRYNQEKCEFEKKEWGGPYQTFDELIFENTVPTLTVLRKKTADDEYLRTIQPERMNWKMGDYPRWLWMSQVYRINYIPVVTGVYRILDESASHSKDYSNAEAFIQSICTMRQFFIEYFRRDDLINIVSIPRSLFNYAISAGNRKKAIEYYKQIDHPDLSICIKNMIAKIPILYRICKGKLFYSR